MAFEASSVREGSVAVVCDDGCDLSLAFLDAAGVSCVDVPVGAPADALASLFSTAYGSLAEKGVASVLSVHSGGPFCDAADAAREAAKALEGSLRVDVVETGLGSVATGMVAERLSTAASLGATADELLCAAESLCGVARLLVVPAPSSPMVRHRHRTSRHRAGLIGRATSSLRVRISGERALYLLSRGQLTQLARDTQLPELTSRLVHAMSAVASAQGPLVYAELETGDQRSLRALEKPLDTNEFQARCLGVVRARESTHDVIGDGSVGVGLMPAATYESCGLDADACDRLGLPAPAPLGPAPAAPATVAAPEPACADND